MADPGACPSCSRTGVVTNPADPSTPSREFNGFKDIFLPMLYGILPVVGFILLYWCLCRPHSMKAKRHHHAPLTGYVDGDDEKDWDHGHEHKDPDQYSTPRASIHSRNTS